MYVASHLSPSYRTVNENPIFSIKQQGDGRQAICFFCGHIQTCKLSRFCCETRNFEFFSRPHDKTLNVMVFWEISFRNEMFPCLLNKKRNFAGNASAC